jgi:hypothetical protein
MNGGSDGIIFVGEARAEHKQCLAQDRLSNLAEAF